MTEHELTEEEIAGWWDSTVDGPGNGSYPWRFRKPVSQRRLASFARKAYEAGLSANSPYEYEPDPDVYPLIKTPDGRVWANRKGDYLCIAGGEPYSEFPKASDYSYYPHWSPAVAVPVPGRNWSILSPGPEDDLILVPRLGLLSRVLGQSRGTDFMGVYSRAEEECSSTFLRVWVKSEIMTIHEFAEWGWGG